MFSFLQGGERKYFGEISSSNEYQYFRSQVPQKKLVVDDDSTRVWTLYDFGPKNIACPLICLPPVSGTADIFFMQVNFLAGKGVRVIALEYPTYWSLREFMQGFLRLLDYLRLDKVHIFGASLGGFLAQKFIENSFQCPRVQSLILCNSFSDTSIFNRSDSSTMFWAMPFAVLKRLIMREDRKRLTNDKNIANAIEFMKERLDSLSQQELASRLTLNCANSYVEPQRLQNIPITIIDVFDHCGISPKACEEMHKLYPQAKKAHLKSGGNFPYLSRSDDVNLHILVHLRQFEGTKYSAYKTQSNSS